ncbi:RadC family protein [Erwinia sp.]|uniref:RadC family protein n=1 Tax=Erwinia citreus TaxID=558 RepID=UPI003C7839F6
MKEWSETPPREKLLEKGVEVLTDTELLALFLRTGSGGVHVMTLAQQLIATFGSLYHLMTADRSAFNNVKGVGDAKYTQINAITELARRFFACTQAQERQIAGGTADMLTFFVSQLAHREREIFMVAFFDNQHRMIHSCEMFAGTLNSVEVHPREIVKEALARNAAALILAHNHPSGIARPSKADHAVTRQIIAACQLMNIQVLDHIVVGLGESVSFAERGWI